jgi:hypothetical protein
VRGRHALHITVVLSKTAHSGPSVCLLARAPCPLRISSRSGSRQACSASCRRERAVQTAGSCASVPPWVKTMSWCPSRWPSSCQAEECSSQLEVGCCLLPALITYNCMQVINTTQQHVGKGGVRGYEAYEVK